VGIDLEAKFSIGCNPLNI